MSGTDLVGTAMLGLVAVVAAVAVTDARAVGGDQSLREELDKLGQRSIFFGHQSVGANILDGLTKLATREGVTLRLVELPGGTAIPPGSFAHGLIEENGNPSRKLESFTRELGSISKVDVAFMKFCYVDFSADTDAKALFEKYQATIAGLKSRRPETSFVHVTAPLTTVQGGPKAFAKRLLGKAPGGVLENARREDYNALLRQAFQGREPIFDLAALQSTRADGGRVTVEWNGRAVPVLASEYTDDGGHLNMVGRLRAARELVSLLARTPAGTPGRVH